MKTAQQVVQLAMMSHGYLSMEEILVSQHSSFTRRVVRCVNNSRFGMLRIAKVLRLLSLSVIYLTFISTINNTPWRIESICESFYITFKH